MRFCATVSFVVACIGACARKPAPTTPGVERQVNGQTIVSNQFPAVDLTFSDEFRYVGSQVVNLYGVADAEQHVFVAGPPGQVERIYWVQFEHYLPNNTHTYNYPPERTTDIGGLQFVYDVRAFSNYGAVARDPRSDGAAVISLLTKHNIAVPTRVVGVRMVHLPSADRRSELMIIYGEALPQDSRTPVSVEGVSLDAESPTEAKLFLQRALQGMTLRRH